MSDKFRLWVLPAFVFAFLVNGLLFFLLPLLTQKDSSFPDMTDPVAVNIVRVRQEEPPVEEEPPPPERQEPQVIKEFIAPDLFRPEIRPVEMEPVPFPIDLNPKILGGPQVALKRFFEAGELDEPPRPVVKMPPLYPMKAKRMEIEGYVKIKFLVDEDGAVSRVSILDASPKGVFEDSVLQTLPSWKFMPGKFQGEPVSSWVVTSIRFELK
jgi:protein TonB